jgi:hypothetical protein
VRVRSDLVADLGLALVLSLAVLSPLLVYGTPDEEAYPDVYAAEAFWTQVFSGDDPTWMGDYAVGVVGQPGRSWMALHPAAVVTPWLGPAAFYRIIWLTGAVFASFLCLRLLRWWEVDPFTRATAAFTVLAADPTVAYGYANDWPYCYLCWTLSFVVLWSLLRLFRARGAGEMWMASLMAAASAGLLVANTPPSVGYATATVLALVALVLIVQRPSLTIPCVTAAVIAAVIALPNLVQTMRLFFEPEAAWALSAREHVTISAIVYSGLRPFSESLLPPDMADHERLYRGVFFGAIFLLAAIAASVATLVRWRTIDADETRRGARRALAIGFLAALVLVSGPQALGLYYVRMRLFRDPLTLLGILMAALALSRVRPRAVRVTLLGLHIAQMVVLLAMPLSAPGAPNSRTVFSFDPAGSYGALLRSAEIPPHARVSLAGSLAELTRRRLTDTGVVSRVDLQRMGYAVINDTWWFGNGAPSLTGSTVMASQLLYWSPQTLNSARVRDLFGIRYVVGFADEAGSTFDSSGLAAKTSAPLGADGRIATVYENPTAWPRAAVLSRTVIDDYMRLGVGPPCSLQCDTLDWNAYRIDTPMTVESSGDSLSIRLDASPPPGSVLLITQAYHPEWRATVDGREVAPLRFLGAFGYVPLTGSERSVVVTFGSPTWGAIIALSFAAFFTVVVAIVVMARRGTRAGT